MGFLVNAFEDNEALKLHVAVKFSKEKNLNHFPTTLIVNFFRIYIIYFYYFFYIVYIFDLIYCYRAPAKNFYNITSGDDVLAFLASSGNLYLNIITLIF